MNASAANRAQSQLQIIPFIAGDGIGPEIMAVTRTVLDAAVASAYAGSRQIEWRPLLAGAAAVAAGQAPLPEATIAAIASHGVALKGPLTTPVGAGHRSLNVALRQALDLYANVRPVRHWPGVASPLRHPERVDLVIFRENVEDVYAGIEFEAGTQAAEDLIGWLEERGARVLDGSAIGIKPMSRARSERLVRDAIRFALATGRRSVTLVHKGNIMKATEGAFCRWGYDVAQRDFPAQTVTEEQVAAGASVAGRLLIRDRIADAMFQELLLRPEAYDVLATPNLNGDYLSDAAAAAVGGLGLAPGANLGAETALFEAVHGTAPDLAGQDRANPSSLLLSGAMMLDHLEWSQAATAVRRALATALHDGCLTVDLAAGRRNVRPLGTAAFGAAVRARLGHEGKAGRIAP